jgi:ligand-binding sensor domain-containing protein
MVTTTDSRRKSLYSRGLRAVMWLLVLSASRIPLRAHENRSGFSGGVPTGKIASAFVHLQADESNDLRFSRLSTADGLSHTRATSIVQDRQGFMWFGTAHGLNRYDGYTYKLFLHDPARKSSVSCVYIRALFMNRAGTLWVGCDRSVERYDPASETFEHYFLGNPAANSSPVVVFSINEDREGTLWVSTADGLYRIDPATGRIGRFAHDPANPSSLSSNNVYFAGEDRESRFWVSDGGAIEELDRRTGRIVRRIAIEHSDPRAVLFYEDHFGTFWITYVLQGRETGLAVLDRKTNLLTRYTIDDHESEQPLTAGIYAVAEDDDNTLWFATWGDGLLRYDRQRARFARYRNHPGDVESIADDRVTYIYPDREGNVWVGLQAMAPNFFRGTLPTFIPLLRGSNRPHSMGEAFINAVYEDRNGVVWAGTTGALVKLDLQGSNNTFYHPPGQGFTHDVIAITEDPSGQLWLGTVGAGLNRFNRATGQFKTYLNDPHVPTSLSNNVVSRMLTDRQGRFWITTWDGLNQYDPVHDHFVVYKPGATIGHERLWDIAEDSNGILWIGGTAGLNRFDPATGQFTAYGHNPSDPRSLSDNTVTSVLPDPSGKIWVATENGLNEFDPSTATFVGYYERDGLPSSAISCVLEDMDAKLWMSTSSGLSKFDPLTRRFRNYSTADGIPGTDFTGWNSCFQNRNGEMFFAGFGGGFAFNPDRLESNADPAPILLTDLQVSGNSVGPGPRSPLRQSISYTKEITLGPDQNFVSLTFAALNYFHADANRYRYRLDGLKPDWVEVGSNGRTATYIALPAGRYTFLAQYQTRSGVWSDPGIALRITIRPPWWATWWFRTVVVGVSGVLIWLFYLYKLRQTSFAIRALMEARLSERERIARDLHDTLLQGVQGLILRFQAVAEQIPETQPARAIIEKTLDRADEIMAQARDRVTALRESFDTTSALPEAFAEFANDAVESTGIEVSFVVEGTPSDLKPSVRDEIYWIGRETIMNSRLHAGAQHIEIEIEYGSQELRVRFRDDGCGIDPAVLESGGRAGHWGLRGMRERASRIGACLQIWSHPGAGTEVEIRIPVSVAYAKGADRVQ